MTKIDLGNRPPTVQRTQATWWPFQQKRVAVLAQRPAPGTTLKPDEPRELQAPAAPGGQSKRRRRSLASWIGREAIALLGTFGAALTVLSQLAWHIPMSRPFIDLLGRWMTWNFDFWLSLYDRLGFYPHAHVQAAVALAVFLAMIGLGARVAARLTGTPLDRQWGLFEGMTAPSLLIMGALIVVFLLGHDQSPTDNPLVVGGNQQAGELLFAGVITAGYAAGDYLGQRGFHLRLYRLAVLILLLLGCNQWLLASP